MSHIILPSWPAPRNVKSLITTKHFPFSHHGELFQKQLSETLGLAETPIWLQQIHSGDVLPALDQNRNKEADASIATLANKVCIVFTADCLPILVCNRQGNLAAAIHAGWRGLLYDIIGNTIIRMPEERENLLFYFGPAISLMQFEVGFDVYNAFLNKGLINMNAFIQKQENKWQLDIYHLAKIQLRMLGIDDAQIYGGHHCTFSEKDLFYSYRRDNKKTGRMASLIWFD